MFTALGGLDDNAAAVEQVFHISQDGLFDDPDVRHPAAEYSKIGQAIESIEYGKLYELFWFGHILYQYFLGL